ncbi:hypothetical protein CDD83_1815 [Cordyceps sp. RAO-2017]|nr:hypothetical protein CDD83_1815 [Cordyceps sp. RAO-2017]
MASSAPAGAPPLRRWDGAKRTCTNWDRFERDPELWMPDGNCLVYLHAQARPKTSSPAFKIPLEALVAGHCFPLVDRFLATDGYRPRTAEQLARWHRLDPRRTVELFDEDSDDEDGDEGDDEDVEPEERAEKLIKEAEEAQEEPVVQLRDAEVDQLAKKLQQTGI